MNKAQNKSYFSAVVIAQAARVDSRTIRRRAVTAGWPRRLRGNFWEFIPPVALRKKCAALHQREKPDGLAVFEIEFARLAENFRVASRIAALQSLSTAIKTGMRIEVALTKVAKHFVFNCSPRSLRTWKRSFDQSGIAGLTEKKIGRVGRKPAAKRRK